MGLEKGLYGANAKKIKVFMLLVSYNLPPLN